MKRVCLLVFLVVALASYAQEPTYLNCANPPGPIPDKEPTQQELTKACEKYHDPAKTLGLVGTAVCFGEDCFTKHQGRGITVVAEGKPGDFPNTWLASVEKGGKLDVTTYKCEGCDQCALPEQPARAVGKGVQVALSDKNAHPRRCKAERVLGEHLYHEHFASNPATKCLAWLECREDNIP